MATDYPIIAYDNNLEGIQAVANLLSSESDFADADWAKVGTPVTTSDSTVAPDGTLTADTLADDSAADIEFYTRDYTSGFDVTKTYVQSLFIKKDATGRATRFPAFSLQFQGSVAEVAHLSVDTSTGEFSFTSGADPNATADVEDYDENYWRLWITATPQDTANTIARTVIFPVYGASATWVAGAAATGSIIAWKAVLEEIQTVNPVYEIPAIGTDATAAAFGECANADMLRPALPKTDSNGEFQVEMGFQSPVAAEAFVTGAHRHDAVGNKTTGGQFWLEYAGEKITNLLTYSEQFDNAAWTKQFITISADAALAPDGTTTADKFAEDSTTNNHRAYGTANVSSGISAIFSYYVKAVERTKGRVQFVSGATNVFADFDLTAETIGAGGTIENIGGGWYRVSITGTTAATTATCYISMLDAAGSASYLGVTGEGLYVWGAQVEEAATVGKYVKTVANIGSSHWHDAVTLDALVGEDLTAANTSTLYKLLTHTLVATGGYYKYRLTYSGLTALASFQIPELFLGTYLEMPPVNLGYDPYNEVTSGTKFKAVSGRTYKTLHYTRLELDPGWSVLQRATYETDVNAFREDALEILKSFWWVWQPDTSPNACYFMFHDGNNAKFPILSAIHRSLALKLVEDV